MDSTEDTTQSEPDERASHTGERKNAGGRGGRGSPGVTASLLWGVVGGLSCLVLLQGFELVTDQGVAIAVKAVVALGVTAVVTALSKFLPGRLPTKNGRE